MNCPFESNVISWLFFTQKRDKDDNSSLFSNIVVRFNDITSITKKRSNNSFHLLITFILLYTPLMHGLRSLCKTL